MGTCVGICFYNHCGADHGDFGSSGGGAPLNKLDAACADHDKCWFFNNVNGSSKSCAKKTPGEAMCDELLCAAAQEMLSSPGITRADRENAVMVATWFCCPPDDLEPAISSSHLGVWRRDN